MSPEQNTQQIEDWAYWSKKVLSDLEDLNKKSDEINKDIIDIKVEIAILKTKAAIWIAAASLVFSTAATLIGKLVII